MNICILSDLSNLERSSVKNLVDQGSFVFYPHEWEKRKEQIQSHINSYNNANAEKYFARKCEVQEISLLDLREFCNLYHIQGANSLALKGWGIFHDKTLLGVLSLGRHHRFEGKVLLDRLCFKSDIRVIGGASKLFSVAKQWAQKSRINEIISFSDNRWSTGVVYEHLGFRLDEEMPPDYCYVDKTNYKIHYSKQSQKKSNTKCPEGFTEREWAEECGLLRIYDAGKKRWVITLQCDGHIWCEYCREHHVVSEVSYRNNVKRNGKYICRIQAGHITGKKPKVKKDNPFASRGEKKCSGVCNRILPFHCFTPDKSRSDGFCSKCKECRRGKS